MPGERGRGGAHVCWAYAQCIRPLSNAASPLNSFDNSWTVCHSTWTPSTLAGVEFEDSNVPPSTLHEVTPGLAPFDFTTACDDHAAFGSLRACKGTERGSRESGDLELPLSAVLEELASADRVPSPQRPRDDTASRRRSLQMTLSKLHGREPCRNDSSSSALLQGAPSPAAQAGQQMDAVSFKQSATTSKMIRKLAAVGSFHSLGRGTRRASLDGSRFANAGSPDLTVRPAPLSRAEPAQELLPGATPPATQSDRPTPEFDRFGGAVDRARQSARCSPDGSQVRGRVYPSAAS